MKYFRKITIQLIILLSCGVLNSNVAYSQLSFVDSLRSIVNSNLPDTFKIDKINEIVIENSSNYPELTIEFSDYAIALSDSINDSSRYSRSINRKGVAYYYMGDYNKAIDQYFKSIEISKKHGITEYISSDYNNIGLVLIEENLYKESLEYFFKAKNLIEGISKIDFQARVYDNIGICYFHLNQFDTALVWFQRSFKINQQLNQKRTLASNIKNIGNVFMQKGNYPVALIHYKSALEIYEELNIKQEVAGLLDKVGLVNAYLGKFVESDKYFTRAQKVIDEIKFSFLHLQNLKSLSKYYELKGNYKKSIQYGNLYFHLSDSLQKADKRKKFEQLKTLVDANSKVKELELLKKLNSIQQETIKNQKTIQIGAIILLVLLVTVLILIYNTLRERNRINKKLEKLVEERTAELIEAKERAEGSDRNKTAFLVNLSHEVRTPINAIVGFSDLLRNRQFNEFEKEEYLLNMQRGTLNLLGIFDKITYLAQLDNKNLNIIKGYTRIDNLFESISHKYYKKIKECDFSIKISHSIPDSLRGQSIYTYPSILEKILDELIENAIKFTGNGEVLYWIKLEQKNYRFYIKDTGVGIDPNHKDRVFDNFTKFSTSKCGLSDGAGIGLTIVKKNLDLIGGTIIITSEKGNGTLVEFTIPFID